MGLGKGIHVHAPLSEIWHKVEFKAAWKPMHRLKTTIVKIPSELPLLGRSQVMILVPFQRGGLVWKKHSGLGHTILRGLLAMHYSDNLYK